MFDAGDDVAQGGCDVEEQEELERVDEVLLDVLADVVLRNHVSVYQVPGCGCEVFQCSSDG